jgi:hypothetical protein
MKFTLKEILDNLTEVITDQTLVKKTTVVTLDDLLIKVSENKNEYFGAFLVYDQRQITLGEWSTTIPFTLVLADKLRPNRENEVFIHSNTLSLAVDVVKVLRTWCKEKGIDGLDNVTLDLWSEDESDSLLSGSKIDFNLILDIGGYCDYPTD